MTYYVPGTEEKDSSKVIMSLQQAHTKTATNSTDIATNTTNIATNTTNIATNTANIATNTTNIASNTSAIALREVLDVGFGSYTTNTSLSGHIPSDDTIPQISEGTQIISVSYTPKSSSSTLLCTFQGQVALDAGDNFVAALFNGASNSFAAEMFSLATAAFRYPVQVTGSYAPGTTSAQTITVRCGSGTANWAFNGNVAGRSLGGASAATLTVIEYL